MTSMNKHLRPEGPMLGLMPLKAIGHRFLLLCLAISPLSHSANDDVLDKSYRLFTDLLVGDFDNQEQFYFDRRLELAESMQHRRNHVQVEATDDDGVFRLTQTLDEADKPARVQFLKVTPDYGSHRIQMTFHEAEDLSGLAVCTVHWRRQLNHFVADDVTGKCSENRNVNAGELLLTPTEFSLFDLALPAREWSEVQGPEATYRNHKAREFTCWMSVTHRDGKATFRPGLKILDQGGRIWLTSDEAEPQTAGIKMRRVRWPTGTNADSLVLYAHRPDEDRAVSYTWGHVDAERIAMNLRWMQASCTLSEE